MAPPALGTPGASPTFDGRLSAISSPSLETESQQPGNFSLDVQDRMGGVQVNTQ